MSEVTRSTGEMRCWNRRGDLLQPTRGFASTGEDGGKRRRWWAAERIVLGGHDGGVPCFLLHRIFAGTSFLTCCNRRGWCWSGYDGDAMTFFAASIFFAGNPFFNILLELYVFFVGTMFVFCWNHINVFRWKHIIFAGTTLLFCWNHISYLLEPCVLLFKLALLFFATIAERRRGRRAASGERRGASGASRSRGQGSMAFVVFFFCACEAKRQGRKRKRTRDLTVRSF